MNCRGSSGASESAGLKTVTIPTRPLSHRNANATTVSAYAIHCRKARTRATIENAAKFPGNDTLRRTVGIYRYSGHLHILVPLHKGLEEIAAVTFVVGNQNFHEDTRILIMSSPRGLFGSLCSSTGKNLQSGGLGNSGYSEYLNAVLPTIACGRVASGDGSRRGSFHGGVPRLRRSRENFCDFAYQLSRAGLTCDAP